MLDGFTFFIFIVPAGSFIAGVYAEGWRAGLARRHWRKQRTQKQSSEVRAFGSAAPRAVLDSSDQLRIVMGASFEKRRILSKSEARVLYAAEKAIASAKLDWRVMAQVSLGEVLSSTDARAYSTINSKRVDLLIISSTGDPIAAIEYQGSGHYQGSAPGRDAVKKEALRKAGVRYIELTPDHRPSDLAREISRLVKVEQLKPPIGNARPQPSRRPGFSKRPVDRPPPTPSP